jgi:hypothetical protein
MADGVGCHAWYQGEGALTKKRLETPRHGIAAFALWGQPFGFTREDVAELRMLATRNYEIDPEALRSLAERISALLPPETTT